jgi:hypothetical protein
MSATPVATRLDILKALTAHMQALNPDNGYAYDLRGKVFRGRPLLGADSVNKEELPVLSLMESPRPDLATYTGEWDAIRHDQWTLLLQGLVRDDKVNPTDHAYDLCAQVEMHLGRLIAVKRTTGLPQYPQEHLLGGRIASLEIAPPVVRPPELSVSASAFFFLPMRLGVVIDSANPFAAG